MLADGFGADPVLSWVFDDPGRAEKLGRFFGFLAVEVLVPLGATYVLPGSCACWTPPGVPEWPSERNERFFVARREAGRTEDGRWIVVDGRRWRASDPGVPEPLRQELVDELMDARRAVGAARRLADAEAEAQARARIQHAKVALGERGHPWWELPTEVSRAQPPRGRRARPRRPAGPGPDDLPLRRRPGRRRRRLARRDGPGPRRRPVTGQGWAGRAPPAGCGGGSRRPGARSPPHPGHHRLSDPDPEHAATHGSVRHDPGTEPGWERL